MLKTQSCFALALATLPAVLLVAQAAAAFAQVADVPDAPFSFKNETGWDLTLDLISVVRRDGREVTYNESWTVKAGQYSWLMSGGEKVTGVTCTFAVRTPGGGPGEAIPLLAPGEYYEKVSAWNWHSGGTSEHGDVCIPFNNGWLKSHLEYPSRHTKTRFTPAIDSAAERHRQWLQYRIDSVQGAIRQDEELFVKQGWGSPLVRGIGDAYGPAMERSPYEADREYADLVGPIMEAIGRGLSNQLDQARAATEARLQSNRALLQKYNAELEGSSTR